MRPEAYEELDRFESTHGWYVGMRLITGTLLRDVIAGRNGLLMLDAGCGAGGNLTMFGAYGKSLGFDYSPLALGYAKKKHAGKLVRASVCEIPYATGTFDLVTTFDVIYHSAVPDDALAIQEMARVTRPGGHVLIRVPAMAELRGSHDEFVHGVRRYDTPELVAMMESAGLTVDRTTYANSLLMPLVRAYRSLERLLPQKPDSGATDVGQSMGPASVLLRVILALEARWIAQGYRFSAGVSLFALAHKKA